MRTTKSWDITAWRDRAHILVFMAILYAPFADRLFSLDPAPPLDEQRRLAPFPGNPRHREDWAAFPARFEAYFNDHFGFRNSLITVNSLTALAGWSDHRGVLPGRDGWLFFRGDRDNAVIRDHFGLQPMTPAELRRIRRSVEAKRAWYERRGLPYLYAVAPDKLSVHPEQLPFPLPGGRQSRLDQVLDAVGRDRILDLRPLLREAARGTPQYMPHDTHWNARGALAAYQAILAAFPSALPAMPPRQAADYSWEDAAIPGDLMQLLGLASKPRFRRPVPVATPRVSSLIQRLEKEVRDHEWQTIEARGWAVLFQRTDLEQRKIPYAVEGDPAGPRALVFRDSFAIALVPYLSEHFARITYVWRYPELADMAYWVEETNPDVVIELHVEREAVNPAIHLSEEESDALLAAPAHGPVKDASPD